MPRDLVICRGPGRVCNNVISCNAIYYYYERVSGSEGPAEGGGGGGTEGTACH